MTDEDTGDFYLGPHPVDSSLIISTVTEGAPSNNSQSTFSKPAKRGWISAVYVGAGQVTPHGRVYCQVSVVRGSNPTGLPVWSGYITDYEGTASLPCVFTTEADKIVVDLTYGQGAASTQTYTVTVEYVKDKRFLAPAPSIWFEPAGNGQGEFFSDSQSPAAGAETYLTPMAFTRWRVHELRIKLVTDATVGTRSFAIYRKGRSPGFNSSSSLDSPYFATVAAGTTKFWTFNESAITEGAKDQNAGYPGKGTMFLDGNSDGSGDRIVTVSTNLDSGDQYTRYEFYEEWAMPNPKL